MAGISSVTVYCSSSQAVPSSFLDVAGATGRCIAAEGWTLVYGGASIGMMGRLADGALAEGGRVIGVITEGLVAYEVAHRGLAELEVVATMHERKQRCTELGDAFLVLPGGFGTLDEMFEAITWKQLEIHAKPILLLDHEGFFSPLFAFLESAAGLRFIRPQHLGLVRRVASLPEAIVELRSPTPWEGPGDKWWREGEIQP